MPTWLRLRLSALFLITLQVTHLFYYVQLFTQLFFTFFNLFFAPALWLANGVSLGWVVNQILFDCL